MDLSPSAPEAPDPLTGMRKTWGGNVRTAREAAGFTRWTLAVMCEVHTSTITRIEAGTLNPSDGLRMQLASALGTSVERLFPYSEQAA